LTLIWGRLGVSKGGIGARGGANGGGEGVKVGERVIGAKKAVVLKGSGGLGKGGRGARQIKEPGSEKGRKNIWGEKKENHSLFRRLFRTRKKLEEECVGNGKGKNGEREKKRKTFPRGR